MQTSEKIPHPPLCASAPVLWSLVPMVAGILASGKGMGWLACAAALVLHPGFRKNRLLVILSLLGGYAMMGQQAVHPPPQWNLLPPREVTARIQVKELFSARKEYRAAGIGKILHTNIPRESLTGAKVAFYLDTTVLDGIAVKLDQVLECRGILSYLPSEEYPNDYQVYLMNRYIHLSLGRGEVRSLIRPAPGLEHFRSALYSRALGMLRGPSPDPESPGRVLASMMLGERKLLSEDRLQLFRRSGTFHLFAVSGLHVGAVALCLQWIAAAIRCPAKLRILIALAGTWFYVWLTGASPSAVRAGIMISCLGISRHLMRQPHLLPALALSAWLVLVSQPQQLFDLGFQLSYCVVGAIILIGLPTAALIRKRLARERTTTTPLPLFLYHSRRLLWSTSDLACISLAAGLASMPLIVQHFSLYTPGGVVLGIVLNPLVTVVIMTGCLSLLAGSVLPTAGMLVARLAWPPIHLMEDLIGICLRVPGAVSTREWMHPEMGTWLVCCSLLLAWLVQTRRQNGQLPDTMILVSPALILAGLSALTIST